MNKNRVVITGMGVITSIGEGVNEFWNAVINGHCGITEVQSFDTSKHRNHFGAEIKNFNPQKYMSTNKLSRIGRASQLAIAATSMALKDSGISVDQIDRQKIGVSLGTTMGEIQVEEEISTVWVEEGIEKVPQKKFLQYPSGNIPANVSAEFGFNGPNIIIPTACAAGNYAIGYGFEMIKGGKADFMVCGGVDPFSRVAFTGFNRLLSMAPDVCRPFDLNRKGMIVGEGVGILVMEALDSAMKRNAHIYAEILGYGLGCDGHHMTAPHPEGYGGKRAIESALKCAGISVDEIQYISAHGTGTKENDRIETKIIKSVFGHTAKSVPMSSIKSMIGHTMGAASAIEAVLCAMIVKNDVIPPTIHYNNPDPECDLDYVPNVSREHKVNIALSNAYAFGGNDAALLVGKFS